MKTKTLLETNQALPAKKEDTLLTDERLMEMIQNHTYDALWLLRERYASLLKQIGAAVLHNDADVEDLLQEVFIEIWKRAARYAPTKGAPLGWVVTLTRRRAIDRLRKRDAYCRASDRFADEIQGRNDSWTHVHEDVARHEMNDQLSRALAGLPRAQRDAIQLAYHRQMSQREIAAQTGIPLGTVKTRLELGLKKMAVLLCGYEDLLAAGKRPVIPRNLRAKIASPAVGDAAQGCVVELKCGSLSDRPPLRSTDFSRPQRMRDEREAVGRQEDSKPLRLPQLAIQVA